MIQAFIEYKDEIPPSSALEETVPSISTALVNGEQALISSIDEKPVGMVRFRVKEDCLYFYRLSVIPKKQGRGITKEILKSLEQYARELEKPMIQCKVRMAVPKNISLYRSIGYQIYVKEIVYKPIGISVKVISVMKQLF